MTYIDFIAKEFNLSKTEVKNLIKQKAIKVQQDGKWYLLCEEYGLHYKLKPIEEKPIKDEKKIQ